MELMLPHVAHSMTPEAGLINLLTMFLPPPEGDIQQSCHHDPGKDSEFSPGLCAGMNGCIGAAGSVQNDAQQVRKYAFKELM